MTFLDAHKLARDTFGDLAAKNDPKEQAKKQFFEMPTHRDAARILVNELRNIIYEPETGEYYQRMENGCYEPVEDILTLACDTVDQAVKDTFNALTAEMGAKIDANVYAKAGNARKKARTRDFMLSALAFFAEAVQVSNLASRWNSSAECLPTETGILDFTKELTIRAPYDGEFFRDPLPVNAEDVLKASVAPRFRLVLLDYFPDPHVYRTAVQCLSLAVANKGNRIFQLWHGTAGANGKNTLLDILKVILPGRVDTLTAAAITRNGDDGAKRFAAAQLDGLTFAAVDEVVGAFDTAEIKRLTGDSSIAVERKRLDAYTLKQRWALAALTNKLPSFSPATDIAFLQRLIIIPFDAVFYFNEEQKERYLQLGIDEKNLKAAKDKDELLAEIAEERPAALRFLIDTYLEMRKAGGRPYECERSLKLKQDYQSANDVIEQFFLEHFKRDPFGRVEYARIMSLWQSFTNEKKSSTREVINKLIARFPWLEKKKSHSVFYLLGLSEGEPDEPTKDVPTKKESVEDNFGVLRGTENDFCTLTIGNRQNPYVKVKNAPSVPHGTQNTSEGETLELDPGNGEDVFSEPPLENQENLNADHQESTESTENSVSTLTIAKQQNPYVKLGSGTFGTFGTASLESEQKPNEPTEDTSAKEESAENSFNAIYSDHALDTSPRIQLGKKWPEPGDVFEETPTSRSKEPTNPNSACVLTWLSELYEEHKENLRKGGIPAINAHVELEELRERAIERGLSEKAFQKVFIALLDSKRIIYEEPYVRINHESN